MCDSKIKTRIIISYGVCNSPYTSTSTFTWRSQFIAAEVGLLRHIPSGKRCKGPSSAIYVMVCLGLHKIGNKNPSCLTSNSSQNDSYFVWGKVRKENFIDAKAYVVLLSSRPAELVCQTNRKLITQTQNRESLAPFGAVPPRNCVFA